MATLLTQEELDEAGTGGVKTEVIARVIYDGFNNRLLEDASQWVSEDCEWIDVPSGRVFRGPNGFLEFERSWIRAFPDGNIEITNMIASHDLVATEFIGRGTQDGPLITATGETIEPSGNAVELRLLEVTQYLGGQIVRARLYYDSLSLLRQIGALETETEELVEQIES